MGPVLERCNCAISEEESSAKGFSPTQVHPSGKIKGGGKSGSGYKRRAERFSVDTRLCMINRDRALSLSQPRTRRPIPSKQCQVRPGQIRCLDPEPTPTLSLSFILESVCFSPSHVSQFRGGITEVGRKEAKACVVSESTLGDSSPLPANAKAC